jgi:hypothetical protein
MIQAGLSVFIFFHLTAVIIAPNGRSYLGGVVGPWIEPYVNALELVSSWNFFAPDPGPPPIQVVYEIHGKDQELVQEGKFPEAGDPFFFRDRQNRRIAAARFMISAQDRLEKVMVPYLCKSVPGAQAVRLGKRMHSIPSLQEVAEGKRSIGDALEAKTEWVSTTYCSMFLAADAKRAEP